jgi:hypothetical protein
MTREEIIEEMARAIRERHFKLRWEGQAGYVSIALEPGMSEELAQAAYSVLDQLPCPHCGNPNGEVPSV